MPSNVVAQPAFGRRAGTVMNDPNSVSVDPFQHLACYRISVVLPLDRCKRVRELAHRHPINIALGPIDRLAGRCNKDDPTGAETLLKISADLRFESATCILEPIAPLCPVKLLIG